MEPSPIQPLDLPIRFPASKRSSTSSSQKLHTISERLPAPAPPIPPKSVLRHDATSRFWSRTATPPRGRPSTKSSDTSRTAPPSYSWVPPGFVVDNESLHSGPVEGEKLAALRRNGGYKQKRRGGWWRLALIAAVIVLVIIALAVGLGVGLTSGRRKDASNGNGQDSTTQPPGSDEGTMPFPLGNFSIVTALKDVSTDCTSNSATWSCYPYSVYDSNDSGSISRSMGVFNWAVMNTSSEYATSGTGSTPDDGIPANISISSTTNLFGITFSDAPLTYISPSSNSSSARYTFEFVMSKAVFPSATITSDNTAAECFFNQTTFTGTLYLSALRDYPSDSNSTSTEVGGYTQWPYAAEVTQASSGSQNTPACYEYINGAVGSAVTTGFAPQPTDSQCLCGYRNF